MNKKYWLRGATIGVIFHIVLSVLLLSLVGIHPTNNNDLVAWIFPNVFLAIPIMPIISIEGFDSVFGEWTVLWWLVFYWFAVGAFFGWLYGKIKNRNKVVS